MGRIMKRSYIALLVICVALTAAAISKALPVPDHNTPVSFYAYMGATAALAVLYLGASLLFLLSLRGFTKTLRRSYGFICFGFTLFGLAFLQLPLQVYGGSVQKLFQSGQLAAGFFFVALLTLIIGMRQFAALFGVRGLATKWWFIIVPPLVLAGLYAMLPHFPTATPEFRFDAANAFDVINGWVDAMMIVQLVQIKKIAGVQYTRALAWMIISFVLQLAAVSGYLIAVLPLGDKAWFLVGAVPLIPLIMAGLSLVTSAHNFSKITAEASDPSLKLITARNFFGRPLRQPVSGTSGPSSVDIVIFAANFASQPRDIDQLLDTVRVMTSRMREGTQLTPEDEGKLRETYLAIENYLLTREQARTFTKQSLRQTIANGLRLTNSPDNFWSTLPA